MRMHEMINLLVIFWLVLIRSCAISAQQCSQIYGYFAPNDTYDLNRRAMLSSLPPKVKANNSFSMTSFGRDSDIAYGLHMCFPGISDTQTCSDCIMAVTKSLLKGCPNQKEATEWKYVKSLCLVHYSPHSFYGWLNEEMMWEECKEYKDTQADLTEFESTWKSMMRHMIDKVNSSFYATDTQEFGSYLSIYAIVQCSKDLTLENCTKCLRRFVSNRSCSDGIQGGFLARTSCFIRWDLYSFWGIFENAILTIPASQLPDGPTNTTEKDGQKISTGTTVAIVVVPIGLVTALLALGFAIYKRRKAYKAFANGYFSVPKRPRRTYGSALPDDALDDIITSSGSLRFDFKEIKVATSNFQKSNKLGHGGFGAVYKGMFPNGTEVAVKRLSKTSDQGEQEFKNEVLLVAKLQHRNLVRLLGFSVEGEEKILVYEFASNKSLDYFLFDPIKKIQLDWPRRHSIMEGITRGILYLHQDSRLIIIHRDLKASNILLDAEMNPKIADFGMARNFIVNQTEANTGRVVGTFGYMPPEYVANGQFSTKSDVYSFGILILEIIGGKKNSSFHRIDGSVSNLVTYVWTLWNNESLLELVDPAIGENYDKDQVIRCIHIGLLCVQENCADRPSMSTIFQMLTNTSITLSVPQPPGFLFRERSDPNPLVERLLPGPSTSMSFACSVDDASITSVRPR